MAGQEAKEVPEEVIDRRLFDFLEENEEEGGESKLPREKPDAKIDKNGEKKGNEEIIKLSANEMDDEMQEGMDEDEDEAKEVAIEVDDTNVEIQRVVAADKLDGSLQDEEKKGFLKKIMEKWT